MIWTFRLERSPNEFCRSRSSSDCPSASAGAGRSWTCRTPTERFQRPAGFLREKLERLSAIASTVNGALTRRVRAGAAAIEWGTTLTGLLTIRVRATSRRRSASRSRTRCDHSRSTAAADRAAPTPSRRHDRKRPRAAACCGSGRPSAARPNERYRPSPGDAGFAARVCAAPALHQPVLRRRQVVAEHFAATGRVGYAVIAAYSCNDDDTAEVPLSRGASSRR